MRNTDTPEATGFAERLFDRMLDVARASAPIGGLRVPQRYDGIRDPERYDKAQAKRARKLVRRAHT
jgi:hypothetical protein